MRRPSLLLLLVVLTACASAASSMRSEERLREELEAHRIQRPLAATWSAALHLLADDGRELVGNDRRVVGQGSAKAYKLVTAGGFETRRTKEGLVLETMEDAERVRYRTEGFDLAGAASQVRFIAIRKTGTSPSEERSRDLVLEVRLLDRLDPEEAARLRRSHPDVLAPR